MKVWENAKEKLKNENDKTFDSNYKTKTNWVKDSKNEDNRWRHNKRKKARE